jgi:hypothetical protein
MAHTGISPPAVSPLFYAPAAMRRLPNAPQRAKSASATGCRHSASSRGGARWRTRNDKATIEAINVATSRARPNGLAVAASVHCPCTAKTHDLVNPQAGHGMPVNTRNGQIIGPSAIASGLSHDAMPMAKTPPSATHSREASAGALMEVRKGIRAVGDRCCQEPCASRSG